MKKQPKDLRFVSLNVRPRLGVDMENVGRAIEKIAESIDRRMFEITFKFTDCAPGDEKHFRTFSGGKNY